MNEKPSDPGSFIVELFKMPQTLFAPIGAAADPAPKAQDLAQWTSVAQRMQMLWFDFQREQIAANAQKMPSMLGDPGNWLGIMQGWVKALPLSSPDTQKKMWEDSLALWEGVLGQYGIGPKAGQAGEGAPDLPLKDRRFADPKWRDQPFYALVHQTYLMLAEQVMAMVDALETNDPARTEQLRFAARTLVEALSPAHFPLTNPLVVEKTLATRGENLVSGMEHLLGDLQRGQLTHVDPEAFKLGENIATTPGKVVHQTPLYQLIQYSPTTDKVLEVPLVIFPPWINRFYILDLSPQKSFIRWAVEQGLTVFVVSWKSADESMADVVWDDYIRAQIEAIDTVRERLGVKSVHTIGYCVAGTTLAATLALMARRGEAKKVKSATFFTAQVDFENSGELKVFIDDKQLASLDRLSEQTGYLDGRYMAATFNLLRGNDLIWNYVVKNYLLGEDYPAFDLLHWNGDVTNLPAKWHKAYLKDLYRDNKLVVPDAMIADGTPIDLTRIETPAYIQAGREDHIAPAASVWKLMHHLRGPKTFLLAGSGHIAGVVNPPSARKYQYWTNEAPADTFDQFIAGATESPGSWWPHWIEWIRACDDAELAAKGKRVPGGKGDTAIEDAPGSYVKAR
ncbi:polyhydroxyalkanoate synthase [Novosphingobium kunmingense]|uniref:Polyhydroxyalkanoate synthase n=1 Tax=Novosphingobium kunmingense TaxID=1211806 RepID=A0A2N0H739_9SPHN|nr:class I poly(R)-hydroxyalkanoic acid synthase [Novosphingobium kunmingense]PKB14753.1 polyhydroxyalkanoate synthase [Novosphingobium kunmingense]